MANLNSYRHPTIIIAGDEDAVAYMREYRVGAPLEYLKKTFFAEDAPAENRVFQPNKITSAEGTILAFTGEDWDKVPFGELLAYLYEFAYKPFLGNWAIPTQLVNVRTNIVRNYEEFADNGHMQEIERLLTGAVKYSLKYTFVRSCLGRGDPRKRRGGVRKGVVPKGGKKKPERSYPDFEVRDEYLDKLDGLPEEKAFFKLIEEELLGNPSNTFIGRVSDSWKVRIGDSWHSKERQEIIEDLYRKAGDFVDMGAGGRARCYEIIGDFLDKRIPKESPYEVSKIGRF